MSMTLAAGMKGNVLSGYRYCGGYAETERRRLKIDNGRNDFRVWTPKVAPKKRRTRKVSKELTITEVED